MDPMTALLIFFTLWAAVFFAALVYAVMIKRQPVMGGLAGLLIAFGPMIYGRQTTSSEWHDSPLMIVHYLPTMLALLLSLLLILFGIVRLAWLASNKRRGT